MRFFKFYYYFIKASIYAFIAVFIWFDFEMGKVVTNNMNIDDFEIVKTQFSTRLIVLTIVIAVIESIENFVKSWNSKK